MNATIVTEETVQEIKSEAEALMVKGDPASIVEAEHMLYVLAKITRTPQRLDLFQDLK